MKNKVNYQFVEDVPESLLCMHCHGVLKNAICLRNCSHAICQDCMLKRKRNDLFHCPCSEELIEASPEQTNEIRSRVDNLLVFCPKGCDEVRVLSELQSHFAEECCMKKVTCQNPGCLVKLKRLDMDEHLKTCDYRVVSCTGCGKKLKFVHLRRHQMAQGCIDSRLKQIVVKQLRSADKEVKRHIVTLKQDSYKTMREERSLQRDYMWRRIERNPGKFSPTLVRVIDLDLKSRGSTREHLSPVASKLPPVSPPSRRVKTGEPTICRKCNKNYFEEFNHKETCSWHAGPIVNVFGGMCQACGRLDNLEGCRKGFHIS